MTGKMREAPFTDEDLTAYLDGELDTPTRERLEGALQRRSDLRRRLGALKAGERPFRRSFEVLLEQAPSAHLQSMLQNIDTADREDAPKPLAVRSSRFAIVAALLCAAFLAGLGFDRLLQYGFEQIEFTDADGTIDARELEEWRNAVAADLGLFTKEGLAGIPAPDREGARELGMLAQSLGMPLPPEKVAISGAVLKRAEILQYEGRPLGQILYLDPEHGPIALCILQSDEPGTSLRMEQRGGFAIGFWADGKFSYMLIGRNPAEDLRRLAESLIPRFSS
jgi:anti-sigma factor RsiW